ncbi:site-2 protease family protein, partial [Patescibacteria group bacterium]|nr:site-2 protease family protein [Patescibacteria group bacterium]
SGPVGVYRAADAATKEGWPAVIYLGVVLSISLAVFNILPVPALDGGRLVFLLTELIFRKRIIAEQLEGWLHMVGFAALMLLILLITISDVRGLI